MLSPRRAGILAFVAAAAAGPWYTAPGYSVVGHVISQLGAQNTPNRGIMIAGFLALGAGLAIDGLRHFRGPAIPLTAFGLAMALAGLFGHRPIDPALPYDELADQIHSLLATAAGISITVALVWQGVLTRPRRERLAAFTLATLCLALPLAMLAFPALQGLIQRAMYLLIFAWLWTRWPAP